MTLPLFLEAILLGLFGFSLGLLLSYLFERRRQAQQFRRSW